VEPISSDNITVEQLERFIEKYGRRATNTMSVLGKYEPFIQAIQTDVGKEILRDDIVRHEILLTKIYNDQADDAEKAEFRYLKRRLLVNAERIQLWLDGLKNIKNN
jgi:hypothetical protein